MRGGQQYRILTGAFKALERYWNDPDYQEEVAAEREAGQNRINKSIDDAMERAGTRWPAHWTEKEKYEASMHWSGGDQ